MVVGRSGTVLTSTNLTSWTSQVSGTTAWLYSVANDGTNFVIVGREGDIYSDIAILTSSNGSSFFVYNNRDKWCSK